MKCAICPREAIIFMEGYNYCSKEHRDLHGKKMYTGETLAEYEARKVEREARQLKIK